MRFAELFHLFARNVLSRTNERESTSARRAVRGGAHNNRREMNRHVNVCEKDSADQQVAFDRVAEAVREVD